MCERQSQNLLAEQQITLRCQLQLKPGVNKAGHCVEDFQCETRHDDDDDAWSVAVSSLFFFVMVWVSHFLFSCVSPCLFGLSAPCLCLFPTLHPHLCFTFSFTDVFLNLFSPLSYHVAFCAFLFCNLEHSFSLLKHALCHVLLPPLFSLLVCCFPLSFILWICPNTSSIDINAKPVFIILSGATTSLNKTQYIPVDDNVTDRDNLLLCDTCVKGQHRTIFGPDSLHVTIINQNFLIKMLD